MSDDGWFVIPFALTREELDVLEKVAPYIIRYYDGRVTGAIAAEREACAKLAKEHASQWEKMRIQIPPLADEAHRIIGARMMEAVAIAAAIRVRDECKGRPE